jgi:hypothetical protein
MSLTKKDLKDVKEIVTKTVVEASEAILEGVGGMFKLQNKRLDERFTKIETDISHIKQDVRDLKYDTPLS